MPPESPGWCAGGCCGSSGPAPGGPSPRAARGASARTGRGRPSAGRRSRSGCRGRGPRASRPAGPARSAARPRRACSSSVNGSVSRSSSSTSSGASPASSSLIEALVDLLEPVAAGLVERGGLHLLEQLADHAADPHHLGRLLDEVGEARSSSLLLRRAGRPGVGDAAWSIADAGTEPMRLAVGAEDDDLLLLARPAARSWANPRRETARARSGRRRRLRWCSTILPDVVAGLHQRVRGGRLVERHRGRARSGGPGPRATSGQTCSTTDAQIARLVRRPAGPAAWWRCTAPRLRSSAPRSSSPLRAALHADDDEPALGGQRVDVAAEVRGAHVVEDDVGAVRRRCAP